MTEPYHPSLTNSSDLLDILKHRHTSGTKGERHDGRSGELVRDHGHRSEEARLVLPAGLRLEARLAAAGLHDGLSKGRPAGRGRPVPGTAGPGGARDVLRPG